MLETGDFRLTYPSIAMSPYTKRGTDIGGVQLPPPSNDTPQTREK